MRWGIAAQVSLPKAQPVCYIHFQNSHIHWTTLLGQLTGIYQILILINRGEAPTLVNDEVKGRAAA